MQEIFNKIDRTVKKHNMLSHGDKVVVGVSGGADSMLLLSYLLSVREAYALTLTVANVEHGIRGESSVKDSAFVESFCKKNNVEFVIRRINAPKEAKETGLGVEEYSRKVRYDFFSSLGADKIATAHNLSDSVETVLFRLSRGSSLKGISGIAPVRDSIIRPLIECTSDEVREYCDCNGIPYVVDETNSENAYSRNYIRNVIIPEFKRLNPSFEEAVIKLSEDARESDAYLSSLASEYCKTELDINTLKSLNPAVAKRAIVQYAKGFNITLDYKHLEEVYALLFKNGRYQLSGNIFAVSDGVILRITSFNVKEPEYCVNTKSVPVSEFKAYKNKFAFYCDCDKIGGNVNVRARLPQDKISPAGRNCTKTLKKLYNELKIPLEMRDTYPVITDDKGVIGVYGYSVDDRVKIDENTKNVLLVGLMEDNS